jgi:hypothetical protein
MRQIIPSSGEDRAGEFRRSRMWLWMAAWR